MYFKWKLPPLLLVEGPWGLLHKDLQLPQKRTTMTKPQSYAKTINTYLPTELLREIFLYSIESNQTKSGQLASICRSWRSVIMTLPSLWSTLRVGTWTEREHVTVWLQRAYPKKVVIETQSDIQGPSNTLPYAALLDALAHTGQWCELTITSFPAENSASHLVFQTASPMNVLRVLHVAAGCVHSPSFTHLLDLVPTEAPLSELRLYPSFASTHFLQSNWFPVLQNLTVLIVNGRGIHEPFSLLPAFTQLHIFEADHLPLPWYEPNVNLPLICTLQKLQIRASSVQWMAGREFACLEECAILFPHHWMTVQRHGVHLSSCVKLTYHCYPMTTVQYFHAPQMKQLRLGSNDCKEQRVYEHLHHLCTLNETIFKLTTLHLKLQCSEQAVVKVLKYLGSLQELVLSISHPSHSWQGFLESLAATPSTQDWPPWGLQDHKNGWKKWEQWYSSQTWHASFLPHLRYLGILCPKGFSYSECIGNSPVFRLVGWTRAQSGSPLEHLKVWEGREMTEDIVVDYISSEYLERYLGTSNKTFDSRIVRGMVTQHLVIGGYDHLPLHQFHMTALFRQLQSLTIYRQSPIEILILPDLEQIKRLSIGHGIIPAYSLNIRLPLVHTLQWLRLDISTASWMLGRSFEALEECTVHDPQEESEHKGPQVGLPACTTLVRVISSDSFYDVSCPNVQNLRWTIFGSGIHSFVVSPKSQHDILFNYSRLQTLKIDIRHYSGVGSFIQHIFCDSWEQGVWKYIKIVEMVVWGGVNPLGELFNQVVACQHHYAKGWRKFTVDRRTTFIELRALM